MADFTIRPITPHGRGIFERGTRSLKQKALQTGLKGCLVVTDANGFVGECAAGPGVVYGVAAENFGNVATDGLAEILIFEIDPADEWEMTLLEPLAQNLINTTDHDVIRDATTKAWYVSSAPTPVTTPATLGDQCKIVDVSGIVGNGVIGDTKTRVRVRFNAANIQLP